MLPIAIASLESHIAYCKARQSESIYLNVEEAENILSEYREKLFGSEQT